MSVNKEIYQSKVDNIETFGEEKFITERTSGLIISETGTRNIAMTSGTLWNGFTNKLSINSFDSSLSDTFTYWHRDGLGGWASSSLETQINNLKYDGGDGLLDLPDNKYGVHFVYIKNDGSINIIYGQTSYNETEANLSKSPNNIPSSLSSNGCFIGRIIILKNATSFYAIENPFSKQINISSVASHNDLTSLQGGTTNEYYHLTANEKSNIENLSTVATTNNFNDLDNKPEIGSISADVGSYHFSAKSSLSGWFLCDGSAISRTTYNDLFTVIGENFGVGDGSTTFNLPDLRGKAFGSIGQGSGLTNRSLGDSVGAETHTLTKSEMPSHSHGIEVGTNHIWMRNISSAGRAYGSGAQNYASIYTADGEDEAHNNMQPTLFAGNVFIKY